MSEENCKLKHSNEPKPGSGQRFGNQRNQLGGPGRTGQQNQQGHSRQLKNPQSEHRKDDQGKKRRLRL